MTFIAEDNIFALGTVVAGLAWLGFRADKTALGRKTSGALWVIVGGLALSNFHVIPFRSPIYDFIGGYLVPLSIPLLLYKANIREIISKSGGVIITFLIACLATALGAIGGYYVLNLGELGAKVAGVYTGGWTGGTVNFIAVAKAVELTPDEFSVAISANSVVSIMALMTLITLPSIALIRRLIPSQVVKTETEIAAIDIDHDEPPAFRLTHVSGALALSFLICAVSFALAEFLSMEQYGILFVTVFVIVIANVFPGPMKQMDADFDLGMLILYMFFASIGAGTDALVFIGSAFILFLYSVFIIVVHLTLVLIAARFLKIDLAEAIVASAAAIVGPAPTAAIAMARGWKTLVTPGIMCGIFGYVIGTFIGVAVSKMLL